MPKSRSCLMSVSAILLLCVPLAAACQKPQPADTEKPTFGIYVLEEFVAIDHDVQILSGDDIISFDPESGAFELNASGVEKWHSRFADIEPKLSGSLYQKKFAIRIGDSTICTGTIWSGVSSQSRDDIVLLDAIALMDGKIWLQLGYPWFHPVDPAISSAIADYFKSR
jgi:hypothetical protein